MKCALAVMGFVNENVAFSQKDLIIKEIAAAQLFLNKKLLLEIRKMQDRYY